MVEYTYDETRKNISRLLVLTDLYKKAMQLQPNAKLRRICRNLKDGSSPLPTAVYRERPAHASIRSAVIKEQKLNG